MAECGVLLMGYGLAGRVFHAPLIEATPGLRIRSVVTSDPERQAQVRTDLPDARIIADPTDAWEHLDGIDLIVIAGANVTHVPQALEAAARGRHMVIDKPIAGTAVDARRIAEAARATGVQVHAFQNRRWDSDFLTLRSIAQSGEIGRPHRLESRFERFRAMPRGTWRESNSPEDLGGVLLDFGAHLVDQAIEIMGPVRTVHATARSVRHADSADDDMQITLGHTTGAVSLLVGSQASAFAGPRLLLLGTRGGVRIDQADTQEEALRGGKRPGGPGWGVETFTAEVRTLDGQALTDDRRELVPGRWNHYYPAVLASIVSNAPPPVPLEDVIANLEVLDAARMSAGSGESVVLSRAAAHS